jgi:hypothetical protein
MTVSISFRAMTVITASLQYTLKNVFGIIRKIHFAKKITNTSRMFLSAKEENKMRYLRPSGKSATKRFHSPFSPLSLKIKKSRNQRLPTYCTIFKWNSRSNLPLKLSH